MGGDLNADSGLGNSTLRVTGPPVHRSADPNKPITRAGPGPAKRECDRVMIKKQIDYGNLNITIWDVLGVAVRLTDKVMRLRELILGGRLPQNEFIRILPSISATTGSFSLCW